MDIGILAPLVVFAVSFVFPMLGAGGSQLFVPALLWMGMDFKTEVIPLALFLNVISSASASFVYRRAKLIVWRTALPFALCAIAVAPFGAWTSAGLPQRPLIAVFATLTLLGASLVATGWRPKASPKSRKGKMAFGAAGGGAFGFLTALVGYGGGGLAVPMLQANGLDPKSAAGTSLFIVLCSTLAGFASHVSYAASPDWSIWAPCIVAALIGSQCGSRLMAAKLDPLAVRILFAAVLGAVALALLINNVILA